MNRRKRAMMLGLLGGSNNILPYSVDFTVLSDGVLPSVFVGDTWSIVSGKAINIPSEVTNLIINGDFEDWTNPTTLPNWSTTAVNQDTSEQYAGASCCRLDINESNGGASFYQNKTLTVGKYYSARLMSKSGTVGKYGKLTMFSKTVFTPSIETYGQVGIKARCATGTNLFNPDRVDAASTSLYFDNAELYQLSTNELFAIIRTKSANVRAIAEWEILNGSEAGVVTNLDNIANPQNFLIAYYDRWSGGSKCRLDKCVAGTYTSLINETVTYVANAGIELRVSGTTAQLFYGGLQKGTDQTIDSIFSQYKNHGLYSLGGNSAKSFFVSNPTYIFTRVGNVIDASELYENGHIQEPVVLYETDAKILESENVFKMWYSGGTVSRNICYAESLDGETWTKYTSNPVIANRTRCEVVKYNNGYIMYVSTGSGLNRLTSTDGLSWTETHVNVLTGGEVGSWDETGIANVSVLINNGIWYMLFESQGTGDLARWQIGFATSPDGITWTKYESNPVISSLVGSKSGAYLTKIGDKYYAFIHGSNSGNLPTDIMAYKSSNMINWTKLLGSDYFRSTADEGVGNANGQVADPSICEVNGETYLFYSALADQTNVGQINLAKAPFNLTELVKYL